MPAAAVRRRYGGLQRLWYERQSHRLESTPLRSITSMTCSPIKCRVLKRMIELSISKPRSTPNPQFTLSPACQSSHFRSAHRTMIIMRHATSLKLLVVPSLSFQHNHHYVNYLARQGDNELKASQHSRITPPLRTNKDH